MRPEACQLLHRGLQVPRTWYQSSTQYQVSILVTKATRHKKAEIGSVTGGLAKTLHVCPVLSTQYLVPSISTGDKSEICNQMCSE